MPRPAKRQNIDPTHVLVLQGGGALGSYQAGAYEQLIAQPEDIGWVAGTSIGAINAALIAGNPRQKRLERLHAFWETVTVAVPVRPDPALIKPIRSGWDDAAALAGATFGVPGFFAPRAWWEWLPEPPVSIYDTSPLRETLLELIDFDLLNDGPMRFSVGAVDIEKGNLVFFDNRHERITLEHVMASGALPPGFGPVQIGKRWYWDGGLVSNTPLHYVMKRMRAKPEIPVTVFQIDLFSARGRVPTTLSETAEREKDIRYSSRTRAVTDLVRSRHWMNRRLRQLAAQLPDETRNSPAVAHLLANASDPAITLVHIIHRRKPYETQTKDYEFSRISMTEHWQAGAEDMAASLELLHCQRPLHPGEFRILDYQAPTPVHCDDGE